MKQLIILIILKVSFLTTLNAQFSVSYKAGQIDINNQFMGGTEMRVLCQHKGKLYGGNETWMDTVILPSTDPYIGAQILRLNSPTGQWVLDKHFNTTRTNTVVGQRTLFRNEGVTALESLIFRNDSLGNPLPKADTILVAACRDFNGIASVYTRNDATGNWIETVIAAPLASKATIRSLVLYRNKATNADMAFAGCLPQGLIAGVYNPTLPGKISWRAPEITASTVTTAGSGGWQGRPMAFTECNGKLYCAAAPIVLMRNDASKTWTEVFRYPLIVTPGGSSGLRGLTAVPNPTGSGQSLLACMEGNNGASIRIDPTPSLPYPSSVELNIMQNLTAAWASIPPAITASYVVIANSEMTKIKHPTASDTCHIITIQHHAALARNDAFYYIRRKLSTGTYTYQLMRIDNTILSPTLVLNSTRACQISPFPSDSSKYLYFGGFDADDNSTHNSAYVLRVPVITAFGLGNLPQSISDVTDEVNNGLLIYPNPVSSKFTIELSIKKWSECIISFYDITGKLCYSEHINSLEKKIIDVSQFIKGVYFVTISNKEQQFTKKVIIQ